MTNTAILERHPITPDPDCPSVCWCGLPAWAVLNARHRIDPDEQAERAAAERRRLGERD
jgi:hypothetical protein